MTDATSGNIEVGVGSVDCHIVFDSLFDTTFDVGFTVKFFYTSENQWVMSNDKITT